MLTLKEEEVTLESLFKFLRDTGHAVSLNTDENCVVFTTQEGYRGSIRIPAQDDPAKAITFAIRFPLSGDARSNLLFVNKLNEIVPFVKFCVEEDSRLCIVHELPYVNFLHLTLLGQVIMHFAWTADKVVAKWSTRFFKNKAPSPSQEPEGKTIH